jgi:hypothetical protein
MEAARTSETSVDNHFTRQYNPEDSSEHHTRRRENLKSHTKAVLHYSLYNLHLVAKEFSMEISTTKAKIMALQGKEHVRSKICIENTFFSTTTQF